MKNFSFTHGLILVSIVMALFTVAASSNLTIDQILNNAYDSTNGTLKLSVSTGTNKDSTAYTNAMTYPLTLQHETSGSPTTGIGVGAEFIQETSASNNETVARIGAIMTDTTAASEDADLVFSLMDAGSAAAEVARLTSDGVLQLEGGATLDNATSASEINLAETAIQLTGVLDLEGGAVTVNDDSGDYDFTVESNDVADALQVDAGKNVLIHGAWDNYEYKEVTDQSYSLQSAGKASNYIQTYSGAATFHLMTELLTTPGAGAVITVKTGGSNDVVIDTEGAETIDGANTYSLDGTYEAVTLTNNGSNWFVLSGYGE